MTVTDFEILWQSLPEFPVSPQHLRANRIIAATRDDPAYTAFDVLRTRILQPMKDNGWKRLAITSPTPDCGKTFVAANLSITLSRNDNFRTLLLDMDLRKPALSQVFGVRAPSAMGDFLRGQATLQDSFAVPGPNRMNIGHNLAIAFNERAEEFASELIQDPITEEVLLEMETGLNPDIILFDTPPILLHDDVLALREQIDAVLLVAAGGLTSASELRQTMQQLGEETPVLGVVMNKDAGTTLHKTYY